MYERIGNCSPTPDWPTPISPTPILPILCQKAVFGLLLIKNDMKCLEAEWANRKLVLIFKIIVFPMAWLSTDLDSVTVKLMSLLQLMW